MSRLVKKLVNWLRRGNVRNDSVTPLENGGASGQGDRNQPCLIQDSDLARKRNAVDMKNPGKDLAHSVSSSDSQVHINVSSKASKKRRKKSRLTYRKSAKRCRNAVREVSKKQLEADQTNPSQKSQDTSAAAAVAPGAEQKPTPKRIPKRRTQKSQMPNRNSPKKRTLTEVCDDSCDLTCPPSKKCRYSVKKGRDEQLQADHTKPSQKSQDASVAAADTKVAGPRQTPKRIPKRRKRRAARRRGKKAKKVPTTRHRQ